MHIFHTNGGLQTNHFKPETESEAQSVIGQSSSAKLFHKLQSIKNKKAEDSSYQNSQYSWSLYNNIPPIDTGFDYEKFPDLSVDQQLMSIPLKFLQAIELKETEKFAAHDHQLTKLKEGSSIQWYCDRVKGASKCLSGIYSFQTTD